MKKKTTRSLWMITPVRPRCSNLCPPTNTRRMGTWSSIQIKSSQLCVLSLFIIKLLTCTFQQTWHINRKKWCWIKFPHLPFRKLDRMVELVVWIKQDLAGLFCRVLRIRVKKIHLRRKLMQVWRSQLLLKFRFISLIKIVLKINRCRFKRLNNNP